ncbi:MAG: adenylosuccinate lyase [Candidatus Marinimicrobia bacterium]|nr:adenylosuccinate lyase [Candidatus Neomarinimicrobiota bacterium]
MIPRYTTPEMGRLWSDRHKYETWLQVELAVCETLAERGEIPKKALANIKAKAAFSPERVAEIEATTKHDVIAFLTNVAEEVGPDARFIHLGMTSSDLLDTSLALLCVEAGELIRERLQRLHRLLRQKAREHKFTWQIGRTHGVHAEPITFGLKLALWSEELNRSRRRWEAAMAEIAVGKLSGAVGTFSHLPPEVEEQVCSLLGLTAAPVSNQVVQRDRHANYLTALALAGASLEKIALEIRHLQRTEVREVEEAFTKGQKGSSAMPHKRNPIVTEQICGLARLLRTNALAAMENVALWHERDISHSSVERIIIPDSTTLMHYLLGKAIDLLEGLVVYPQRMMANLKLTGGLIFSQNVLLALVNKGLTREQAYALVQRPAMQVWEQGGDFKRLLQEDREITDKLPAEELEACFNYDNLGRSVEAIFKRIGLE